MSETEGDHPQITQVYVTKGRANRTVRNVNPRNLRNRVLWMAFLIGVDKAKAYRTSGNIARNGANDARSKVTIVERRLLNIS